MTGWINLVGRTTVLLVGLATISTFSHAAELKTPRPNGELKITPSRGLHTEAANAEITFSAPNSVTRFTTDGSVPEVDRSQLYRHSLRITNTTLLRAAAFVDGKRVSSVATHSYIFVEDVLRQSDSPKGWPSGKEAWNGEPSAYRMDARGVTTSHYEARVTEALRSLPIVSVVCKAKDIFGERGLYLNTEERGPDWERLCSVEMVLTNGDTAFQIDCGLRIHGNMNRVPANSPKHAFRLSFKSKFGAPKLRYRLFPGSPADQFDDLVLRADYNNSWIHWDPEQARRGQRIRDAWMKDSARAMGWSAPHNRYVHLFLNGLYWGIYDLAERVDSAFAAAVFGGKKDQYDVINEEEAKDGDTKAFEALQQIQQLDGPGDYAKLRQLLNVTNYADFLLLNFYAGNLDWGDYKNSYLVRRRTPDAPFQFVVWDGEHILNEPNDNVITRAMNDRERYPFASRLLRHPEFRGLFSERVRLHCTGDGALTPSAAMRRWMARAAEVDAAIVAETARWGYHRRVPPFSDADYHAERSRLVMLYFPRRTSTLKEQLKNAGLLSVDAAPRR